MGDRCYSVGPLLHLTTRWQMRWQVCGSAYVFKTFNQSGGWTSWLGFWLVSTSSCKDKGEQVVLGSVIWLSDWSVGDITWSLRWLSRTQARIQKNKQINEKNTCLFPASSWRWASKMHIKRTVLANPNTHAKCDERVSNQWLMGNFLLGLWNIERELGHEMQCKWVYL